MGLIHIELFATLDLVGQSPGSPDEDPVGFAFGGWQAPLIDEVTGAQVLPRTTAPTPSCSAGAPTTSSPPTGRTSRARSPRSSTASRSTSPPAAGPTSRGPGPRSSAPTWPAPCARSATGTARQGGRQPEPGADPAAREALRPPRPLGAPGRARRREEGVRRRRGTHERHAPRTAGRRSTGTVYLRYGLADGTPRTGDMSAPDNS